jgi:hypothetical protein
MDASVTQLATVGFDQTHQYPALSFIRPMLKERGLTRLGEVRERLPVAIIPWSRRGHAMLLGSQMGTNRRGETVGHALDGGIEGLAEIMVLPHGMMDIRAFMNHGSIGGESLAPITEFDRGLVGRGAVRLHASRALQQSRVYGYERLAGRHNACRFFVQRLGEGSLELRVEKGQLALDLLKSR